MNRLASGIACAVYPIPVRIPFAQHSQNLHLSGFTINAVLPGYTARIGGISRYQPAVYPPPLFTRVFSVVQFHTPSAGVVTTLPLDSNQGSKLGAHSTSQNHFLLDRLILSAEIVEYQSDILLTRSRLLERSRVDSDSKGLKSKRSRSVQFGQPISPSLKGIAVHGVSGFPRSSKSKGSTVHRK